MRLSLARAADPGGGHDVRGVALVDASERPHAWLKFGSTVTMAEARTQLYVARVVNGDDAAPVRVPTVYLAFEYGHRGFIAMEYIDGAAPKFNKKDVSDTAIAVQYLASIRAPDAVPGPTGGDLIYHPIFCRLRICGVISNRDLAAAAR